jgi:hypothetical protein
VCVCLCVRVCQRLTRDHAVHRRTASAPRPTPCEGVWRSAHGPWLSVSRLSVTVSLTGHSNTTQGRAITAGSNMACSRGLRRVTRVVRLYVLPRSPATLDTAHVPYTWHLPGSIGVRLSPIEFPPQGTLHEITYAARGSTCITRRARLVLPSTSLPPGPWLRGATRRLPRSMHRGCPHIPNAVHAHRCARPIGKAHHTRRS